MDDEHLVAGVWVGKRVFLFSIKGIVERRTMNRGTYWSDIEIKAIWGATDLAT